MTEIVHRHATGRWRHLPFKLLATLLMIGGSIVATSGAASAASRPSNVSNIDVIRISNEIYVVGALSKSGHISVETVVCPSYDRTCQKHGWTDLGGGFTSMIVEEIASSPVVIGLRSNGDTWFRRGSCSGIYCSWGAWRALGGTVTNLASSSSSGCARLAGKTRTNRVYRASICENSVQWWTSTGGTLSQIAMFQDRIFGTSPSGSLWWNNGTRWMSGGGRITQPSTHLSDSDEYCGLAGSGRNLWCFSTYSYKWTNWGCYWRKLDDSKTIGIGKDWSAWTHYGYQTKGYGGSVNQIAEAGSLHVAVGSDYRPWYQNTYDGANGWNAL